MTAERYWEQRKDEVLSRMKAAKSGDEALCVFQGFWEELRTHVLSAYAHEDILRQQIILLFKEAATAAEMLLIQEAPVVSVAAPQDVPAYNLPALLRGPLPVCAAAAFGLCLSMMTGGNAWPMAMLFAAIAAMEFYLSKNRKAAPQALPQYEVKTSLNPELFEKQMQRQVQLIDAHISDLQALQNEALQPMGDVVLDKTSVYLCQYVWASAKQGYPVDSTLMMAEKLMAQNDMEWVPYQEDRKNYFDVMPTRRESRMVFPALRKTSDGTLVCKGQYLKATGQKNK